MNCIHDILTSLQLSIRAYFKIMGLDTCVCLIFEAKITLIYMYITQPLKEILVFEKAALCLLNFKELGFSYMIAYLLKMRLCMEPS